MPERKHPGSSRLLILGDLVPGWKNLPAFLAGDVGALLGDVEPLFRGADGICANLECPLTDTRAPIERIGGGISAPTSCAGTLALLGVRLVFLGNNHIMDHGAAGLASTMDVCRAAGILTVGAGRNEAEAVRPVILEAGGVRVAFFAAQEFFHPGAEADAPGPAELDPLRLSRELRAAREDADVIIVSYHSGFEHYPYPTPRQQEICRFLIEQGAGLVVCQHSHIAGCMEEYRGGTIVYGQGDFLFDAPHPGNPSRFTSVILDVALTQSGIAGIGLIPVRQREGTDPGVRLPGGGEADALLAGWNSRSREISDPARVRELWRTECLRVENRYLSSLATGSFGRVYALARRMRFGPRWFTRDRARIVRHLISNPTHREVLDTLLKERC